MYMVSGNNTKETPFKNFRGKKTCSAVELQARIVAGSRQWCAAAVSSPAENAQNLQELL